MLKNWDKFLWAVFGFILPYFIYWVEGHEFMFFKGPPAGVTFMIALVAAWVGWAGRSIFSLSHLERGGAQDERE